ncbi:hypothetical protein [Candidatus Uabimicrobium amorphum]|uniref:Uncharacterized protein n=1 Tax=Uabimicrobium amorphum TaxID=2596890 RepID=A0A5S9IUP2_UABAM|nr:hypothetical protein [Candidatus Uabimicrobium amorphum]BBM87861.1 hypothetical protein UABAM_06276 [Candidatus Uabimicrobium amorphum]
MEKDKKHRPYRIFITLIALVFTHIFLLYWLSSGDAFAVLTASGQNTPTVTILTAAVFIGLRLYLYLLVPGVVAARIAYWAFDKYVHRSQTCQ